MQQAITLTNNSQELWHHLAWLGQNELILDWPSIPVPCGCSANSATSHQSICNCGMLQHWFCLCEFDIPLEKILRIWKKKHDTLTLLVIWISGMICCPCLIIHITYTYSMHVSVYINHNKQHFVLIDYAWYIPPNRRYSLPCQSHVYAISLQLLCIVVAYILHIIFIYL